MKKNQSLIEAVQKNTKWEQKLGLIIDINAQVPVDLLDRGLRLGAVEQWEYLLTLNKAIKTKLIVGVNKIGDVLYLGQEYPQEIIDKIGKYPISLGQGIIRERYIFGRIDPWEKATSRKLFYDEGNVLRYLGKEEQIIIPNLITDETETALRELEMVNHEIKPSLDLAIQKIKQRQIT